MDKMIVNEEKARLRDPTAGNPGILLLRTAKIKVFRNKTERETDRQTDRQTDSDRQR